MEKIEVKDLMKRIKNNYPEFTVDEDKFEEWYKELKGYDLEDVTEKLEKHLRNEEYSDKPPKLYYLTRYLVPAKEKNIVPNHRVVCQFCGEAVLESEYQDHYDRCRSAYAIAKDLGKYFGYEIDENKIRKMTQEKYNEVYDWYLRKMLTAENLPDMRRKVILTCLGENKEINITEEVKNMVS